MSVNCETIMNDSLNIEYQYATFSLRTHVHTFENMVYVPQFPN